MSTITTRAATASRVPWRTVGLVALLILALAVGAASSSAARQRALPAPFGPAANGQIAVRRRRRHRVARHRRRVSRGSWSDGPTVTSVRGRRPTGHGSLLPSRMPDRAASTCGSRTSTARTRSSSAARSSTTGWVEWSPDGPSMAVGEPPRRRASYDHAGRRRMAATTTARCRDARRARPMWRAARRSPAARSVGPHTARYTGALPRRSRRDEPASSWTLDPGLPPDAGSTTRDYYFDARPGRAMARRTRLPLAGRRPSAGQGHGLQDPRRHASTPAGAVLEERIARPHDAERRDSAPTWLPDGDARRLRRASSGNAGRADRDGRSGPRAPRRDRPPGAGDYVCDRARRLTGLGSSLSLSSTDGSIAGRPVRLVDLGRPGRIDCESGVDDRATYADLAANGTVSDSATALSPRRATDGASTGAGRGPIPRRTPPTRRAARRPSAARPGRSGGSGRRPRPSAGAPGRDTGAPRPSDRAATRPASSPARRRRPAPPRPTPWAGCPRSGRRPIRTAAADLAPQPGMPGKPSDESPTSPSQSGIEVGATPHFSRTPASS